MPAGRTLGSLLADCDAALVRGSDRSVSGIAYDSREVRPGMVFVAIPGHVHDGADFIPDALRRGAAAIVAEVEPERVADAGDAASTPTSAGWARVPDARVALARMACTYYGHPSSELTTVGVTGTNGKTSTAALLEELLSRRGPAGRWSTTAVSLPGRRRSPRRTTPEAPDLQAALREMVDAGAWAAALEVSSHALTLHRVDGTRFDAAVFTNLSPEHLDFHGDMEGYLEAKALLFRRLPERATAVLNADEPASTRLADVTSARVVTYGWGDSGRPPGHRTRAAGPGVAGAGERPLPTPDYGIAGWTDGPDGSSLELETPRGRVALRSRMSGPANAENLAAAVAAAAELGLSADDIVAAVDEFQGVPGRLERVDEGQEFSVVVDYAHTPAALDAALRAARSLAPRGRVLLVFGCGGDRDRGKRPSMGAIATDSADVTVVTSDNPRGEDPAAIVDEILEGADETADVRVQVDRRAAIETAIEAAGPGDCVLIAGKGHETDQVFRDRTVPFDDRRVARECLAARRRRAAPKEAS